VSRFPHLATAAALASVLVAVGLVAEQQGALAPLKFSIQRTSELMPSTVLIPDEELRRGLPTVSLYVADRDLYDPATGILSNKNQHGRAWERPATITYLENGRALFSSTAGVRVHGGGSRLNSPQQGYRVYLGKEYEAAPIPPGLVFGPPHVHPVRVLMVHNDVRVRNGVAWALTNPLAYDIAAAVGGITSPARPVRFLLNGRFQGVFVLYEHFHPNHYFRAHGQRAIRLNNREFEALSTQVRALAPFTMATAGEIVDVENLTRWFMAIAFCATRDPFQGPSQFRDASRPRAQWFWVNWDMDASFGNARNNPFDELLLPAGGGRRGRRTDEVRPYLMTMLLTRDPAYREYFKAAWVKAMNHRLSPAFLRERFEHYRQVAISYGVESREYLPRLEAFLAERPAVLREHASHFLETQTVWCRLVTTQPVLLDGNPVSTSFAGYYFLGMRVTLDVPPSSSRQFDHWRVNGIPQPASQTAVTLTADQDLTIQAIWH
jgi:hypothetical protein